MSKNFNEIVEAVSHLLCRYSVSDVATSLFVSSLWLPNISSQIKHQLLYAIFASLKPDEFSAVDTITSYGTFRDFLGELYSHLPSFPVWEDYVPELDWGEVKFHHEDKNYKIFFGNEVEDIYDYLSLFQILYSSLDGEYRKRASRSPNEELRYTLGFQEEIISGINTQPSVTSLSIDPGHLEVPPEHFWEEVSRFYQDFDPSKGTAEEFLERFTCRLGDLPESNLDVNSFGELLSSGSLLPFYFVEYSNRYFAINPRRYSAILVDEWGKLFKNHYEELHSDSVPYSTRVSRDLSVYLKKRIRKSRIFSLVSAIELDGRPHDVLFSAALVSKNRLLLVYVTPPAFDSGSVAQHLRDAVPQLKKALKLASNQPTSPPSQLNLGINGF